MEIRDFGKGCIPDKPDDRDFILEKSFDAPDPFDWDKGFDVEDKLDFKLKIENQGKSSSCVGQAFSNYLQILDIVDTGKVTDLSAKDIYSRIFQPQGGASLRDAAKLAVSRGVSTEISNPSYQNGNPPAEAFMRELVAGLEEEAKVFSSKNYYTTTHNSIDFFAAYIRDNNGLVSGVLGDNDGWRPDKSGIIKPPKTLDWGHALYFSKAKMINGVKYLGGPNSWGEGWGNDGYFWLGQNYFGTVNYHNVLFGLWVLRDNKLINKRMKYARNVMGEQYLLDDTLMLKLNIGDEAELAYLVTKGLKGQPAVMSDEDLGKYEDYPLIRKTSLLKSIGKLRDQLGM